MWENDELGGIDREPDKLFSLEFITLFGNVPKDIYKKLVHLIVDYFTSSLFLSKHLPNGICGEMVNGEASVLRDLASYLYITNDPLLLDYPINAMGILRDKSTNDIATLKIFILTMKTQTIEVMKNGKTLIPIVPSQQPTKEEKAIPEKTGFRDKDEGHIFSNHMVRLDGEVYGIVKQEGAMYDFAQWIMKNEKNSKFLMDCHWKVEIVEAIPEL